METFKPVVGYEGVYEVSDEGRVRRVGKPLCLKPGRTVPGYLFVNLSMRNVQKMHSVHRLVAIAFFGPPDGKMDVNHKNGVKTDNRALNLEWATRSQNQLHANANLPRKHTSLRGRMVPNAILDEGMVKWIRKMNGSISAKQMAFICAVNKQTIYGVLRRKSWAWVA